MSPVPTRAYWTYRFYDESGVLLYVGYTTDPKARFYAHSRSQPWWSAVTRKEIQNHPTAAAGLAAERKQILEDAPLHNKMRASGPAPPSARFSNRPAARKLRTYKCEDEIYDAAMAKVDRLRIRGGLSTVIRDFLEQWAADDAKEKE